MSFTLWFMGRPASGKSTLASRMESVFRNEGIAVENLDGDEIRQRLHPELGFSREDRLTNNRRTALLCKLLNRNGISVVNAMITPFRESQRKARTIVQEDGTFVLVYVKCSVEEATRRDPKGLYEKALDGKIENFTGINHPFQEPHNPEIVVDTGSQTVDEAIAHIRKRIHELDIVDREPEHEYEFEISRSREREIKDRLQEFDYLETPDSSTERSSI